MEAGKKTINDIFNGNRILEIPFFQRSYVWEEEQWERLLEDMEAVSQASKPYFLGSIILKQQNTETGNSVGDKRTVIDGQQRVTTINIFFKVLCLKIENQSFFDRVFRLVSNDIALLHNHNDIDSFNRIINLHTLEDLEGADNITRCYNFFKKIMDPEKLNIQNILSRILFVGIDLDGNEDEQQIFDTINSLGVTLTTAELLKNYFFDRDDLETYNLYWKNIFEKDEETKEYWDTVVTTGRRKRTFIDLFFYSYLQIKIYEPGIKVNSQDKKDFSKVENLFESYKIMIKDYGLDKKKIISEIKEYASLFRQNFDYEIVKSELTDKYGIERINAIIFGLETSTLIPYTLYVLKNVNVKEERNSLFQAIESYIMRRMVVKATTKDYNRVFTDRLISNTVLSRKDFVEYISDRSDKVNYFPDNEDLEEGFHNSRLINRQSAGILYFIESMIRDRSKQATQLLGLKKYSLEHLMPKKWETNWGPLDTIEERDRRNRKLLTLGNLAIITQSLNSSIRDSAWEKKKHGSTKKPGLMHFSGGIETLAPFLKKDEWDESEIKKRADYLYKNALSVWKPI